jgi:polyferredoxin
MRRDQRQVALDVHDEVMRAVGVRHRRLRQVWDRRLKWIKYGVLAGVLGLMWVSPSATELAVEIEPFKTAISLYFVRDWPYVAWAIGCIALSVFVYRGYCRYICPLGAALAALDPLRRLGWLPRRDACGTPCQTCRHRCDYQAIRPNGTIDYAECFQCMDCVVIYHSDTQCAPRILQARRGVTIPIRPVSPAAEVA